MTRRRGRRRGRSAERSQGGALRRSADRHPAEIHGGEAPRESVDPGSVPDELPRPPDRVVARADRAGVAVLLAAVGIFSVLAYLVGQRTREIAVRRAVGAQATDIIRVVVGEGLRLVAAGLVLGLAGALAVTRLFEGLLFEIRPWDLSAYVGAVVVLGFAALLAILIPALRAVMIAPLVVLQQE